MPKKLTEKQRDWVINILIEGDLESLKIRDYYDIFYNGCTGYKNMTDKDLREWCADSEIEIPSDKNCN